MAINKNFLQLEFKSGMFFEYSGTEKEGYEKYVSSTGKESYRKYYKDGVTGVLESVKVYDGKFSKQLSLSIKNGDDIYYVPVDIFDQSGNVDSNYAESLVKLLPNLEKGVNVTVRGYNFTPEGEQYAKIGISIKNGDNKVERALSNSYYKKENGELVKGDIPALEWVEKLGKKKPSATSLEKKDDYLIDIIEKETKRLEWTGGESNTTTQQPSNSTPTATPQQAFAPADENKSFVSDEDDNLPF